MRNDPPGVIIRFPITLLQLPNPETVGPEEREADEAELGERYVSLGDSS